MPLGGVARRATSIRQTRWQTRHVLLLDAGNSLTTSDMPPYEPGANAQGRLAVQALNRMRYDAVALGPMDLLLGRQELMKRIAEAETFSFLSANLVDRATGQLIAKPYVMQEVAGHRVALIGITGAIPAGSSEFATRPPLEAAQEQVQRVRSQADIVILLSNAGASANKLIASQVPDVDIIISGGQESLPRPVRPDGRALVVQAELASPGHAGCYLGRLRAELDRSGSLAAHNWETIELNPSVADDPEMSAWVASLPKPYQ